MSSSSRSKSGNGTTDVHVETPTNKLYRKFYAVYKKCHPFEVNGRKMQINCNSIWNEAKRANHKYEDLEKVMNKIIEDTETQFLQSKASSVQRLFNSQVRFFMFFSLY